MNKRSLQRSLLSTAVAMAAFVSIGVGAADATESTPAKLGFTPITTDALPCSAGGLIRFADSPTGQALSPTVLMRAGDAATPINAPATSNKVGRVNDMIALSPDGTYLYTVSENGSPAENNIGAPDSDGVTRLTLKGPDAGRKAILAANVVAGVNKWSRVDGITWYGGAKGVLLISEEFATGGVWQVDPDTGAYHRLDWLGNYAHEGIAVDHAGNLYLGDESRTGAIYKAVPNDRHDLTKGGELYFLVGNFTDITGWRQVENPVKAITEASKGGAVLFDRPEDFEEANGRIYFTVTEPQADADKQKGGAATPQVVNRGGIYSFSAKGVPELATQSGGLPYNKLTPMIEVNDRVYKDAADAASQQGLQFPDNLAFDGRGHLWVHEDIPDGTTFPASGIDVSKQLRNQQDELYVYELNAKGDAIVANPDRRGPGLSGGYKAADMRNSPAATPCEHEFSGGIFAQDGKTLYINQQHADGATLMVRIG